MYRLPAIIPAIGIIAGIVLATYLNGLIIACLLAAAFVVLYVIRRPQWAFALLMIGIGSVCYTINAPDATYFPKQKCNIAGVVKSAKEKTDSWKLVIAIDSLDRKAFSCWECILTVLDKQNNYNIGDRISCQAVIESIENDNPLSDNNISRYYINSGIMLQGITNTARFTYRNDGLINRLRKGIYNAIVSSPVSPATASFLVGIILGDDSLILEQTRETFRSAGISHVLALSGLHVGIIAMLIGFLFVPLRLFRHGAIIQAAITLALIWIYAAIANFTPSILRAAIMMTVLSLNMLIQRGYSAWNALALTVIVILVFNPLSLYTPGFQLSVVAVMSILAFVGAIPQRLQRHRVLYFIVQLVAVPCAAMLGTGMLTAWYFSRLPLMFLLPNIVAGILMPWILGSGLVLVLLSAVGVHPLLLGKFTSALYALLNWTCETCVGVDGSELTSVFFSPWIFVPFAATLILLAIALNRRSAAYGIWSGCGLVVTILVAVITTKPISNAEIFVLPNKNSAEFIIRDGGKAYYYNTSDRHPSIDNLNYRYDHYLRSHGCDEGLTFIRGDVCFGRLIIRNGYLCFDDVIFNIGAKGNVHAHYGVRPEKSKLRPINVDSIIDGSSLFRLEINQESAK